MMDSSKKRDRFTLIYGTVKLFDTFVLNVIVDIDTLSSSSHTSFSEWHFQSRIVLSPLQLISWSLSTKTTALTSDRWQATVWLNVASFFRFITLFKLDSSLEAKFRSKKSGSGWFPILQTATVRSFDPVASKDPDLENEQDPTWRWWWSRRCKMFPDSWKSYFIFLV